jgi:DNA-binding MurR/RpiR family transcriptional regulator
MATRGMAASASERRDGPALGYAQPGTYEELMAVLSSGSIKLPKRLRQVAVYLTQHPADVALGTISTVAADVGVQPSTLVRFAQIFGYAGFSGFQALFKAHVKSGLPLPQAHRDGEAPVRRPRPERRHALSGIIEAATNSLVRLEEQFDQAAFDRIVGKLAAAPIIYLVGSKRAFPVTAYVSLTLSLQGVRNVLVDNIGSGAHEQLACLGPADCVLAVSFSPYNSITPELTEIARDRGATVLALTDSPLSPLVTLSEDHLVVVEASDAGYRAISATMVTGLGLALAVSARRSARPSPT